VLLQCFERRCLTYAPDNPPGWQVEAGNVGQHYHAWRYGQQNVADGPSALANELARTVMTAASDEARYQALLEVMGHLNIGVYTGNGQLVLQGAERGVGDFYLYDIELRMMAGSVGRRATQTVEDLAAQLTAILIPEGGPPIAPASLHQALLAGADLAAQSHGEPSSLAPLLVRQLGLYHAQPYDLFGDAPQQQIRLDSLQTFLILADFLVPAIAEHGPVSATSTLLADSHGILKPAAISDPCDPVLLFGRGKGDWQIRAHYKKFMSPVTDEIGTRISYYIDGIHSTTFAFSITIESLNTAEYATHYGPPGHTEHAGKRLDFRIFIFMLDTLPEELVNCGWLADIAFPEAGPIEDAWILWNGVEALHQHGQVICAPSCDRTNVDGVGGFYFQPRDEILPGVGEERRAEGTIRAQSLVFFWPRTEGRGFQARVPAINFPWVVQYHEPPGHRVTLTADYAYSMIYRNNYGTVGGERHYSGTVTYEFMLTEADLDNLKTFGWWWATGSGHASLKLDAWTLVVGQKVNCGFSWSGPFDATVSFELSSVDPLEILLVSIGMPEHIPTVDPTGMCSMSSTWWISPWFYELEIPLESDTSLTLTKPAPSDAPHHETYYTGSGWSLQIDVD
jgi:hypothetical protein